MIRGVLNDRLELTVCIEISNGDGSFHPVEAVLDTGFSDDLTLPQEQVARLGLKYVSHTPVTLAGNHEIQVPVHDGYVNWFGRVRRINVLAMEGQPLLGMTLLKDCKITIHARPGGEALIEEDGEA